MSYALIALVILFLCIVLISSNEYFSTMPGFVYKVLVERELNYWILSPESGNIKNSCLTKLKANEILRDDPAGIHKWMRWARKNGYDIVMFPYKPSNYDKDKYVYNEIYDTAYVGKRDKCMTSNNIFEPFKQENYMHHKCYLLNREKLP